MLVPELLAPAAQPARSDFSSMSRSRPRRSSAGCPWREQIVAGLLGADLVSFQTDGYRENFVRTCRASASTTSRRTATGSGSSTDRIVRPPPTRSRSTPPTSPIAPPAPVATRRLDSLRRSSRDDESWSVSTGSTTRKASPNACARSSCYSNCAPAAEQARLPPSRRAEPRRVREYRRAPQRSRASRGTHQRALHRARPRRPRPLSPSRRRPDRLLASTGSPTRVSSRRSPTG